MPDFLLSLFSPFFALLGSLVTLVVSVALFLFGKLYGNHQAQDSLRHSLALYASIADSPISRDQSQARRTTVSQQQISGHRYGWFREELYHVPLETGAIPLSRKRACRHQNKTLGALLLIHGFAQNRQAWDLEGRSLVNYLAEAGYDVFFVDLRGTREGRKLGATSPKGIHEVWCLLCQVECDMTALRVRKELTWFFFL